MSVYHINNVLVTHNIAGLGDFKQACLDNVSGTFNSA